MAKHGRGERKMPMKPMKKHMMSDKEMEKMMQERKKKRR